jgi:putative FmdB family regulatory protein
MPVYSFECKDCGNKFDLLIGVTRKDEEKVCKKCGSSNIKRVFASFNVSNKDNSGPSCPTGSCPLS